MASPVYALLAAGEEFSGQAVRGAVQPSGAAAQAAVPPGLEQTVAQAAQQLRQGLEAALQGSAQAAELAGQAVDAAGQAAAVAPPVFTWGGYIQAVGVLFVLVALFCLALWLARRFGRFRFLPRPGSLPRDALVMEAQLPLGPRKGLMVVRFLNKRLLLGITDQRITLLSEEQAQHEPDSADFQEIMEDARRSAGR